jgi:sugar lactone lactonase YvrE
MLQPRSTSPNPRACRDPVVVNVTECKFGAIVLHAISVAFYSTHAAEGGWLNVASATSLEAVHHVSRVFQIEFKWAYYFGRRASWAILYTLQYYPAYCQPLFPHYSSTMGKAPKVLTANPMVAHISDGKAKQRFLRRDYISNACVHINHIFGYAIKLYGVYVPHQLYSCGAGDLYENVTSIHVRPDKKEAEEKPKRGCSCYHWMILLVGVVVAGAGVGLGLGFGLKKESSDGALSMQPEPSASPSYSPSPSYTASPSNTASPSTTASASPTDSPSATTSASYSTTATTTSTASPSSTATPSCTASSSATPSLSPSASRIVVRWPVTTIVGGSVGINDGTGTNAQFNGLTAITSDSSGFLYVTDTALSHAIRKVDLSTLDVTTIAGSTNEDFIDDTGTDAAFHSPAGLFLDETHALLYVADTGNNAIRVIDMTNMVVTTLAGNGNSDLIDDTGTDARFSGPTGLAWDGDEHLYVADSGNGVIRMIVIASRIVSTVAGGGSVGGDNAVGLNAEFSRPYGIAFATDGLLWITDMSASTVRTLDVTTGDVVTMAGQHNDAGLVDGVGTNSMFNAPRGIMADFMGNVLIVDHGNNAIRRISGATHEVVTGAGGDASGYADGSGTDAQFDNVDSIAMCGIGSAYVTDTSNYYIRKVVYFAFS